MHKVAVINDYMQVIHEVADWSRLDGRAEVSFFHDHLNGDTALIERLAPFDIVVSERERAHFTAAVFAGLPRLKLLCVTGFDNWHIDFDAARAHGVTVCNTGSVPGAMPELAWGLMLALSRNIVCEHQNIRNGGWQSRPSVALQGKRLGILGLGINGKRMAEIGKAFRMEPMAWSTHLDAVKAAAGGAQYLPLDELLATSDVVTIQLVLSERTRGLIGRRELALMKPTAFLINTSRGPIVDEAALIHALRTGRIAGAGLDVYDVEPLPVDHPLRALDNVVLTPHIGYITEAQYKVFYGQCLENILAWLDGAPTRVMTAPYSLAAKEQAVRELEARQKR